LRNKIKNNIHSNSSNTIYSNDGFPLPIIVLTVINNIKLITDNHH
jgi:hypothetical protein